MLRTCFSTAASDRYSASAIIAISILVVDDDPTFRRLARRLLAAHGLVVVAEAGSVADALSTARTVRPTATLVDVELPDGDGFALAGELSAMA
jgi:CheY-like chemotaxis protein